MSPRRTTANRRCSTTSPRYVFRIALTRIVGLDEDTVTIKYKDRKARSFGLWQPVRATMPHGCGRCCNCRSAQA
jgi:hypothetical protein